MIALPTEKQSRETRGITPFEARVLLAGMPGAGKSTLLGSWAPETTLILDTQEGTALLDGEHYVQPVRSWQDFTDTVDALAAGDHNYRTIGIDMIDDLWRFCDAAHAGKDRALASSTDDWQSSIKEAEGVFIQQIQKLIHTGMGVWFLSHTREVKDGDLLRYRPSLDPRVLTYLRGACHFVLLAETLGPHRNLHSQPSARFECKARVPLPDPMPMDARELYAQMKHGLAPVAPVETREAVAA